MSTSEYNAGWGGSGGGGEGRNPAINYRASHRGRSRNTPGLKLLAD